MTNKEIIETLTEYIDHLQTAIKQAQTANDPCFDADKATRDIEAFQMAIKALEAQPYTTTTRIGYFKRH